MLGVILLLGTFHKILLNSYLIVHNGFLCVYNTKLKAVGTYCITIRKLTHYSDQYNITTLYLLSGI